MAEEDRFRVSTMFATDADFEIRTCGTAPIDTNLHQLANTVLVNRLERVSRNDVVFEVVANESFVIVAAHAESRLRQVVGTKAEELSVLSDGHRR